MTAAAPVQPALRLEPHDAFPELAQLTAATRAGDWPAVTSFFAGLPDDHHRAIALGVVTAVPDSEHFLTDAIGRDPGSPLARVLYAQRYIILAWQARTGQRAKYVSQEQFAQFRAHLVTAERVLVELTAWRPDYALGWANRLTTSMGLSLGREESKRRYAQLAKVDPNLHTAQSRMLQLLCPKWSGSWEEMFAFARECAGRAVPGSLNPSLVADAHLERYLELPAADRAAYLRSPEVVRELQDAARASVLHPDFRPVYGWVGAHSMFAAVFSFAGLYPMAAVHFRALGDLGAEHPWSMFGDAAKLIAKHRAAALAGALA